MDYHNYVAAEILDDDRASDEFLLINACATQSKIGMLSTNRPNGRLDYHIILVLDGKVTVTMNGIQHTVTKNKMIYYAPHEPQFYEYEYKTSCIWLHITGSYMPNIIETLKLSKSGIYNVNKAQSLEPLMNEIITILDFNSPKHQLLLYEKIFRFFATLKQLLHNEDYILKSRLAPVMQYLNTHRTENIDMRYCADMCSLSLSRFYSVFKEEVGIPPAKYVENLRIAYAKTLLAETDDSIGTIAEMTGYADPLYFSRVFKTVCGCSPANYRKRYATTL